MPKLEPRKVIRVFLGEDDRYQGHPLSHAITRRMRRENIRGVSIIRGIEGYGQHSLQPRRGTGMLSGDSPIIMEIIESPENLPVVLQILDEMMIDGEVIVSDAQGISYGRSVNPR